MYMVKRSFWNAALFLSRRWYDGPKLIFKIFIYTIQTTSKFQEVQRAATWTLKLPERKLFISPHTSRGNNLTNWEILTTWKFFFRWIIKKVGDFFLFFFFYYGWLPWQVRLFLSLFYTLFCLPEVGVLGRRRFHVDLWTLPFVVEKMRL